MLNIISRKKEIKLQGDTIPPSRIVVKKEIKAEKSRKGQNNKCWQVCKENGTLRHCW